MEAPDQSARADDPRVRKADRGANEHFALEVAEYLPALSVNAEIPRGPSKADLLKMLKQPMNVVRTSMQRPAHRRANAHNPGGSRASAQLLLHDFRWVGPAFHVKQALAARVRSNRSSRSGRRIGLISVVAGHGLHDAIQIVKGRELDDDFSFTAAQFHFDARLQRVGKAVGQVAQARSGWFRSSLPTGALLLTVADRHDLLDRPDR